MNKQEPARWYPNVLVRYCQSRDRGYVSELMYFPLISSLLNANVTLSLKFHRSL